MSRIARSAQFRFFRHLLSGGAIVLAAAIVTHALHGTWLFRHLENANIDTWLLAKKARVSQNIFVVLVTDDDYRELFHRRSPLDQRTVQQVIAAIAAAHPRAIGIDLDTSEWEAAITPELPSGVPLVWAREASGGEGAVHLEKVLGGDGEHTCFGVPSYMPDSDGIIRSYEPDISLTSGRSAPSLARAIATSCREVHTGHEAKEREKVINFIGDRLAFEQLSSAAVLALSKAPQWLENNPMRGRIVLLGGAYKEARDRFPTPVGFLDGVHILAQTVESELPGGGVHETGKCAFFGIDVFLGLSLIAGAYFLPRTWALLVIFLVIPVLALVASWAAFQTVGYFASFVPVLGGVFVHEVIEHVREHHELVHECRHLRAELQRMLANVRVA